MKAVEYCFVVLKSGIVPNRGNEHFERSQCIVFERVRILFERIVFLASENQGKRFAPC